MPLSPHDEALRRYQRTWRWTALVPSAVVSLAWLGLVFTTPSKEGPAARIPALLRRHVGLELDGWKGLTAEVVVILVHLFAVLTPMLAWDRVHAAMRETPWPQSSSSRPRPYRASPRSNRVWSLTSPFPWWSGWALVLVMGVGAMWLPLETIGYMIGSINLLGELAYASFFYVWWRRCWRDSACVAILEEAIQPDGTPGLLLHTVAGVHPVKLVECDPRSRRLRMSAPATAFGLKVAPANSAIWWQAVESIDNLVRAHGSPTADDDR